MIAQLKDKGSVSRGWIGVQIQPVTADIADSLGLKKAEGALVAEPQANGPAAKAGIESGDVITAVNGETVKDARELARTIGAPRARRCGQAQRAAQGPGQGHQPDARPVAEHGGGQGRHRQERQGRRDARAPTCRGSA